jgi:hypothetical protein
MTTSHKLRAPNPDLNGVKVEGYDRIQVGEDGYFHVHDSNLVAKLQGPPWFMTTVAREGGEVVEPTRKDTQRYRDDLANKTLAQYSRRELIEFLSERGHEPANDGEGISDADLLAAAELVKEEADKKAKGPAEGNTGKSNKKDK